MDQSAQPEQSGVKVAIIGSVVNDRILPFGGGEIRSLGGLTYTIVQMALLAPDDWRLYPVCRIGADIADRFYALLDQLPNVRKDAVLVEDRENTRVTLVYRSPSERQEYTTEPMPPLQFRHLQALLDASIAMVNFITGTDVEIDALEQFSAHSDALIYVDLHSLTLGIGEGGLRYYRVPEGWQRVARVAHVLQMNEHEAACLLGKEGPDRSELVSFGLEVLGKLGERPFVVNITLDGEGSLLFWQDDEPRWQHVQPHRVQAVDPTGCGDSFAAGFIRKYWETGDPLEAARFANLVAGLKCTVHGADNLRELRTLMNSALKSGTK